MIRFFEEKPSFYFLRTQREDPGCKEKRRSNYNDLITSICGLSTQQKVIFQSETEKYQQKKR